MKSEFLVELAEVLQMAPSELTRASALTGDNWDSVAIMSAIAAIDKHYGVTLPGSALTGCRTVGDLFERIEARLPHSSL